jgi:hypothetical protein
VSTLAGAMLDVGAARKAGRHRRPSPSKNEILDFLDSSDSPRGQKT